MEDDLADLPPGWVDLLNASLEALEECARALRVATEALSGAADRLGSCSVILESSDARA